MGWVINLDLKNRTISLRGKIIFSFLSITVIIILAIALFVTHTFENEFGKYVDESNKVEVNHLIEFDLKNIHKEQEYNCKSFFAEAIQPLELVIHFH